MAAEPVKLTVLKALSAHLEGIKGPDWGDFDLTDCVFRGRAQHGAEAPPTFLSIIESPRPDIGREAGENRSTRAFEWPLLLQGWTKDDPKHPTDPLYYLLDQVERRLNMIIEVKGHSGFPAYRDVYMLGGLITSFSFGPGVCRQPTDGVSSTAFLYVPLRVGLATIG